MLIHDCNVIAFLVAICIIFVQFQHYNPTSSCNYFFNFFWNFVIFHRGALYGDSWQSLLHGSRGAETKLWSRDRCLECWCDSLHFTLWCTTLLGRSANFFESMLSLILLLVLLFPTLLISNVAVFIGLKMFKVQKMSIQNFSRLISFHFWKLNQISLSKYLVYHAETEQGVAQAIIRSVLDFRRDPWPRVSENAKDLVKRMLDPDPRRRLTAQEVLGNDWCFFC